MPCEAGGDSATRTCVAHPGLELLFEDDSLFQVLQTEEDSTTSLEGLWDGTWKEQGLRMFGQPDSVSIVQDTVPAWTRITARWNRPLWCARIELKQVREWRGIRDTSALIEVRLFRPVRWGRADQAGCDF
jgi:hypothetical protein